MNKTDLIAEIAKVTNGTKLDIGSFLDGMIQVMCEQLKKGESISITGLWTISADERSAREGRHPRTGEKIHIPAKKTVKIKAGNLLKEAVKN